MHNHVISTRALHLGVRHGTKVQNNELVERPRHASISFCCIRSVGLQFFSFILVDNLRLNLQPHSCSIERACRSLIANHLWNILLSKTGMELMLGVTSRGLCWTTLSGHKVTQSGLVWYLWTTRMGFQGIQSLHPSGFPVS